MKERRKWEYTKIILGSLMTVVTAGFLYYSHRASSTMDGFPLLQKDVEYIRKDLEGERQQREEDRKTISEMNQSMIKNWRKLDNLIKDVKLLNRLHKIPTLEPGYYDFESMANGKSKKE